MEISRLIRALPKIEQHVHIVGATRPETLLWLLTEGRMETPFKTVSDVRRFFQYRDFSHFIAAYCTIVGFITREDQFERLTYEMLEDEARSNVRYVEASFSAPDHVRQGLSYELMLDAINRGVRRANTDFGIQCSLRVDLVRNYGPEAGMQTLDWIESKSDNIVSVDIGGSEEDFSPKPFAHVFQRARKMGLNLVAHAGEAAGPESIWEAMKYLKIKRVGHGVSASRDSKLVEYILRRDVALEMCPTSNLKTRVVSSLEEHPIRSFFDKGIKVTVNTDDPSMFNTSMNKEYLQLHRQLGFTVSELLQLTLNALESSFLPQSQKTRLRSCFIKEYQRLADSRDR